MLELLSTGCFEGLDEIGILTDMETGLGVATGLLRNLQPLYQDAIRYREYADAVQHVTEHIPTSRTVSSSEGWTLCCSMHYTGLLERIEALEAILRGLIATALQPAHWSLLQGASALLTARGDWNMSEPEHAPAADDALEGLVSAL